MSLFNISNGAESNWSNRDKILLRFFSLFFLVQIVPVDIRFYRELISIDSASFNFYHLFKAAHYYPHFFGSAGFTNWIIAAVLAGIGALAWSFRANDRINYDVLYYWVRVILRYRLAIGIIAYGLIKLFPLQMPYPSLSNLHTNYGDFYAWKIYFHTLGIVQGYEVFLGGVELLAGVLLLFRRTTTFGAGIIIGFTGNVFAANIAYHAGEQMYSAFLLSIALFLFAYDAPRLFRLLVAGKFTHANKFRPVFAEKRLKLTRLFLKSVSALFILVLGAATFANFKSAPYKYPSTPGLNRAYGFYNVREFRLNNRNIPYSITDPDRWQNVVFEKWSTLSIKTAKPIKIDDSFGDQFEADDAKRNFESAGVGGRRYFAYNIDSANQTLHLQNKNKNHIDEKFHLQYSFVNDSTIILQGVNEKNDSVYALLDRINKKYLLQEGRRRRVKL
jgi:hypothetical protein